MVMMEKKPCEERDRLQEDLGEVTLRYNMESIARQTAATASDQPMIDKAKKTLLALTREREEKKRALLQHREEHGC